MSSGSLTICLRQLTWAPWCIYFCYQLVLLYLYTLKNSLLSLKAGLKIMSKFQNRCKFIEFKHILRVQWKLPFFLLACVKMYKIRNFKVYKIRVMRILNFLVVYLMWPCSFFRNKLFFFTKTHYFPFYKFLAFSS